MITFKMCIFLYYLFVNEALGYCKESIKGFKEKSCSNISGVEEKWSGFQTKSAKEVLGNE